MKKASFLLAVIVSVAFTQTAFSQAKTYTTSGGEIIFSWGDLQYTSAFQDAYSQASIVNNPVRFTAFFHIQQFWHLDLTNNIGFFTGIGVRNIGMISDESLPTEISDDYNQGNPYNGDYFQAKVIRRTYSLGVPLAIKLGSFKDHLNIYAGGEIEWSFHMKEKYWKSHTRSGSKAKTVSGFDGWFPNQITTILPSTFIGLQFPGGVNLKVKYYIENFLNHNYKAHSVSSTTNQDFIISDLTKYEKSNLVSVSLAFHFKTAELFKQKESSGTVASIY